VAQAVKFKLQSHKKKPLNREKRQSMEWEKVFANHISSKGFISRIGMNREFENSTKKTV
jgi:hypothetical protein